MSDEKFTGGAPGAPGGPPGADGGIDPLLFDPLADPLGDDSTGSAAPPPPAAEGTPPAGGAPQAGHTVSLSDSIAAEAEAATGDIPEPKGKKGLFGSKAKKPEAEKKPKAKKPRERKPARKGENGEDSANDLKAGVAFLRKKAAEGTGTPPGGKKGRHKFRRRKVRKDQVIRIEDLEEALANENSDIDPEAVVSMYLPHRRLRRFAAVLLHTDRIGTALLVMVLGVCMLFILAFMQEKMGNFTINLNRLELYRRGISISDDGNFSKPTARLTANTVENATNISGDDLPGGLDGEEGEHNGKNYMAYTYFVRNAGKEDLGYTASIKLEQAAKGADKAARIGVWYNGDYTLYAAPSASGTPEKGCTNFESENVVCSYTNHNFLIGNVDKYTVVIWIEGDDPECLDNIVGGAVQFSMNIDADFTDKTNLLVKFIQDIVDTLTGNNPINAAGTEAPDHRGDITWDTRRNQGEEEEIITETDPDEVNITALTAAEQGIAVPSDYEGALIMNIDKTASTMKVKLVKTGRILTMRMRNFSLSPYTLNDYVALNYTLESSTISDRHYGLLNAEPIILKAAAER